MKKRIRIILPLILVAVIAFFVHRHFSAEENGSRLKFSGNVEVTEAQLSFRIAGILTERLVDEGDQVQAGELLALLDSRDQRIGVALVEANLAYAQAVLAELVAGSRREELDRAEARVLQARQSLLELQNGSRSQEVERARAARDSAKAAEQSVVVQLQQAKNDFDRYAKLFEEASVSENIFENSRTLHETSRNRVKEARARRREAVNQLELIEAGPRIEHIRRADAALKQAEAEYALVKAGPREETLDQARAKVRLAEETLKQAKQQLGYTELTSPMDAVVLSTSAENGEFLNPASPVLTLGSLATPWLRAYINEKDLGRIKLGQQVTVSTDSYPGKIYRGRVSYISGQAEFTPKTVQTFEERVKLMYRIKVHLENPQHDLKPGMPADGVIDLSGQ